MTNTTPADEREAFEAWAESPRGSYVDAWAAWQARAASQPAQEPMKLPDTWTEGEKSCFRDGVKIGEFRASLADPARLIALSDRIEAEYVAENDPRSQPAQEPFSPDSACKSPDECRKEERCVYRCTPGPQPAQEPVAWALMMPDGLRMLHTSEKASKEAATRYSEAYAGCWHVPLYAAPPSDTAKQDRIMELADEYAKAAADVYDVARIRAARAALEAEVRKV